MGAFIDLTGKHFGRWTVVERSNGTFGQNIRWLCRCDCGTERNVVGGDLRSGKSICCGCVKKHGYTYTPTYTSWNSMIQRCTNPNNLNYHNYGGRGIKVCDTWRDFRSFLADMGEKPEGTSLDRIDNDMGYCKENCRWATRKQQANNRRTNNNVTFGGKTLNLKEWSELCGVTSTTIYYRIFKYGWPLDQALTTTEGY